MKTIFLKSSIICLLICHILTISANGTTDINHENNNSSDGAKTSGKRPKVGLVLGGGGAKGAAEVGVLKVIEEAGVPIDYIAGTSIGSILGGLYSLGYRSADLEQLFLQQEWLDLFAGEMLEGGKIEALFDSIACRQSPNTCLADSLSFDDLPIPYRCVAVDLRRMEEVVLSKGKLSRAMRASMAIPVALRSVEIDGRKLVDGGLLNNLPVDVVRQMGADVVIAVDLQQNKHKTKSFSLKDELGIGGFLDWLISRPDWNKYNDNCDDADIYINPPLDGYSITDFSHKLINEMMTIGEKEARKHMKELRNYKRLRK